MSDDREKKGQELRQRLFGAGAGRGTFPESMQRHTVEHLFGDVWQGPELSVEERSLITCAVLVALGRAEQQQVHFRGARNLGISREKLEGMIDHVMHYAGWPTGATAARVLKEVWEKMDAE